MHGDVQNMDQIVLEDMENVGRDVYAKGIFRDEREYYFLWYEMCIPVAEILSEEEYNARLKEEPVLERAYGYVERFYVKDEALNTEFYVQIPNMGDERVLGFCMREGTVPTVLAEDEQGVYWQQIDTAKQEFGAKRYLLDAVELSISSSCIVGRENGLLYCLEGYLYELDYNTGVSTEICSLPAYGIEEKNILYLNMAEDRIEILSRDPEENRTIYSMLKRGISNKSTLTFGIFYMQEELAEIISRYNREQTDVRIEPILYTEGGLSYEEARVLLQMDMLTGNGPDMIDVSGLNYSILSEKDILVDLYTCMEQDNTFDREKLVDSVAAAYEIDGHLYAMAPSFLIHSMWGKSSVVGEKKGLDLMEFKELLAESNYDFSAIGGFSVDEPLLVTLCSFGMKRLIQWDDRTCDFEGTYFKEILEFVREFEELKPQRIGKSVENGGIAISSALITGVEDYQMACERFGEAVSFVGYPTEGGTGNAFSLCGAQLAISADSEYVREAWDFVKYYLWKGHYGHGFPVVQTEFDAGLLKAQQETNIEAVNKIRQLIEQTEDVYAYDTSILNIIEEEAAYYFAGQKSIEEVASVVQNRVSLYLAE